MICSIITIIFRVILIILTYFVPSKMKDSMLTLVFQFIPTNIVYFCYTNLGNYIRTLFFTHAMNIIFLFFLVKRYPTL